MKKSVRDSEELKQRCKKANEERLKVMKVLKTEVASGKMQEEVKDEVDSEDDFYTLYDENKPAKIVIEVGRFYDVFIQ